MLGHEINLTREQNAKLALDQYRYYPKVESNGVREIRGGDQIHSYPPAPRWAYPLNEVSLPACPGVYFLFRHSRYRLARTCYYVGSSSNLRRRVTVGHSRIDRPDCLVTWLETADYLYTESYYIGLLRPEDNACSPCAYRSDQRIVKALKRLVNLLK